MRTVSQLQTLVRFYGRDDSITLTSSPNLEVLNKCYRELASLRKWYEIRVTASAVDITTTSSVGQYNWPDIQTIDGGSASTTSWALTIDGGDSTAAYATIYDGGDSRPQTIAFANVTAVEVGIDASDTSLEWLLPPPHEAEWSDVGNESASIPVYYLRYDDAGAAKIELRPKPSYTGATIQVTGYREPKELRTATDTTIFQTNIADDVLCQLVAAEFLAEGGEEQLAQDLIKQANTLLALAFKDKIPDTLRNRNTRGS